MIPPEAARQLRAPAFIHAQVGRVEEPGQPMAKRPTFLEQISQRATAWTGTSWAFAVALGIVVVWAATGPIFNYSDTWQLIINTGTTVVTFLMVFLIQRSQNKESQASQLKLNEIVASMQGASNRLINVENLSEAELRTLHEHYGRLVKLSISDGKLTDSHSVEEAEGRHRHKSKRSNATESSGGEHNDPSAAEAPQSHSLENGLCQAEKKFIEIDRFLRAAAKVRETIRWHQEQAAAHQAAVAALSKELARHGVRMKALAENPPQAPKKEEGAASVNGVGEHARTNGHQGPAPTVN